MSTPINGLDDGWHHFDALGNALEPLATTSPPATSTGSAATPGASVVYASLFSRNRYRYREPRTFRTVHMDVGHLMETCALVAAAHGLRVVHHLSVDEHALASELRLDPTVECPIAVTELTAGIERDER